MRRRGAAVHRAVPRARALYDETKLPQPCRHAAPRLWPRRIQIFALPVPDAVEALRQAIYPHLAPIANRWRERLGEDGRFPPAPAPILPSAMKQARSGRRR